MYSKTLKVLKFFLEEQHTAIVEKTISYAMTKCKIGIYTEESNSKNARKATKRCWS